MLYQPQVQGAVSQLTEKFKVLYQPQRVGYTINRKVQGAVSQSVGYTINRKVQGAVSDSVGYTINRKVQGAVSATECRVHN